MKSLPQASLVTRIISTILFLPYFYIGVKELISPAGIDITFGIPLTHDEGLSYLSVVGARNIVLSSMGIFFAITGLRFSMITVFIAMAIMAAMDCYLVTSNSSFSGMAIKHFTFVIFMLVMAAWTRYSGMRKNNQ
ncbi:DUF4267 domain-containing protein [Flammeovirga kamogawensis]|uniref:DUF4267 domain-containing protein n=1 Tax=Flammeovirga kamogawensis TaxID=373891 RepID=A0ABX8GZ01_9BACT|nr:DUF4267 domain-containing protein [Flammeovirga kamogawensis]MBB6459039.1 hypothetical protein [Flammeovirga kamogawensis]QWG08609.1 DUF4267 domain-containing protein [Flammeovirga kamogawensis]